MDYPADWAGKYASDLYGEICERLLDDEKLAQPLTNTSPAIALSSLYPYLFETVSAAERDAISRLPEGIGRIDAFIARFSINHC